MRAGVPKNEGLIHRTKESGCHLRVGEGHGRLRARVHVSVRVLALGARLGARGAPTALPILVYFVPSFPDESRTQLEKTEKLQIVPNDP